MSKIQSRLTPGLRQQFPEDFLWGASVSAHQVEGGTYNQWTKWELEHAKESAELAEKRWSWIPAWDKVKAQALDPANYVSGQGIDHYHLYKSDFKLLKALGMNSFRFSIEWSRIEPEEGVFNIEAIQFYKQYMADLRTLSIMPIPTLWHWTVPVWFDERGGFTKKSNLVYWRRFIEKIADELDWSEVTYVLTLNETNTYIGMAYYAGEFPHRNQNYLEALRTYTVLVEAHKIAAKVMKKRHPHLKIGIAHQINKIVPKRANHVLDKLNAAVYRYMNDGWFLGRVRRHLDFIGDNFYFTDYRTKLQVFPSDNPKQPVNDLGWYMEPEAIYDSLLRCWNKYHLPILVTENGVADMEDSFRLWWITETMQALAEAKRKGVDLLGYLHWSLLDNFEWQYGWFPKFGLIAVDRKSLKRSVKPSTKTWAKWLRS